MLPVAVQKTETFKNTIKMNRESFRHAIDVAEENARCRDNGGTTNLVRKPWLKKKGSEPVEPEEKLRHFYVPLTDAQFDVLRQFSTVTGKTLNDWVREFCLSKISFMQENQEKFVEFVNTLNKG